MSVIIRYLAGSGGGRVRNQSSWNTGVYFGPAFSCTKSVTFFGPNHMSKLEKCTVIVSKWQLKMPDSYLCVFLMERESISISIAGSAGAVQIVCPSDSRAPLASTCPH